jgi:hypothetical protein
MGPTIESVARSSRWRYVVGGILLNLPFVLCHPDKLVIDIPLIRSLAINLVLFVVPGLPFFAVAARMGWLQKLQLIWLVALSFLSFVLVLISLHAVDIPIGAGTMWNGEWLVTDLGFLANVMVGGPPIFVRGTEAKAWWRPLTLLLVAYIVMFHGATRVVPVLGDQDDEVQGTAHGLMMRLEPSLATGRGTQYMFAHPPLLHVYVAGSLTYFSLLDRLAVYDPKSPGHLSRSDGDRNYFEHPYLLETRTPNLFFAALTVSVLGWWVASMTGRWWFGTLVALTYMSCPEVFVRSSYGGYFATDNFFLLQMLLAVDAWSSNPGLSTQMTCVLAGAASALADHKMMLLPASLAVWETVRRAGRPLWKAVLIGARHPVILGFGLGTAIFWAYGVWVSPSDFWMDHVRHHLVDRVLHRNVRGLDMSRYPGVAALWIEFLQHTGYLLVPFGGAALAFLCREKTRANDQPSEKLEAGWRAMPGLWAIWAVGLAVAFSSIDWRQTKHLASLTLPLFLALGRIGASSALRLGATVLLCGLLIWNLSTLHALAGNFGVLRAVPEW